jgi:hypothetical protein
MSSNDESPNNDKNMDVDKGKSMASSNADDNFAVALEPPAKKTKSQRDTVVVEKETAAPRKRKAVVPRKRNKRVVESDSDDDNDNGAFLTSCKKLLKDDPLDFN